MPGKRTKFENPKTGEITAEKIKFYAVICSVCKIDYRSISGKTEICPKCRISAG